MLPRLLVCLSLAACAGTARPSTTAPQAAPRFELCRDPAFRCLPALSPVKVDTNLERHDHDAPVASRVRA